MATTQLIMMFTMIACTIGIIIQDIFMAVNNTPGDTFSELFGRALQYSLFFQVALGIILGHLCIHIDQTQFKPAPWMTMGVLGMLSLIAISMDIPYWCGWIENSFSFLRRYPIILIQLSMLIGYFTWPQRLLKFLP